MFADLPLSLILGLIFAHIIADFFAQTDKMAFNKNAHNDWLTFHAASYTLIIFIIGTIFMVCTTTTILKVYELIIIMYFWATINGLLHWIVDYVIRQFNIINWEERRRFRFYITSGIDQLIHLSCLFITLSFIASYILVY